jgi:shikimate kinase
MKKVTLIGPRSVGKSTIAKELHKLLNIDLIDLTHEIFIQERI